MFSGAAANDDGNRVWVYDLARRTHTALTPRDEHVLWGQWSPDGSRVVFERLHEGKGTLYARSADGTGGAEPIVEARRGFQLRVRGQRRGSLRSLRTLRDWCRYPRHRRWRWRPQGIESSFRRRRKTAIPAFRPTAPCWRTCRAYLAVRSVCAALSGTWSPGPDSTGGGTAPAWKGDGRELYYHFVQDGALRLMAVPLTVGCLRGAGRYALPVVLKLSLPKVHLMELRAGTMRRPMASGSASVGRALWMRRLRLLSAADTR